MRVCRRQSVSRLPRAASLPKRKIRCPSSRLDELVVRGAPYASLCRVDRGQILTAIAAIARHRITGFGDDATLERDWYLGAPAAGAK